MKKQLKIDDMDVVFDPKPLTKEEEQQISNFIKLDKAKRKKKAGRKVA